MAAISVTASAVLPSANATLEQGTAGATITAGQTIYKDASNLWQLADANGTPPSNTSLPGIAVVGSSANQPILVCRRDPAFTPGFTVLAGDTLWTSPTAGGITKTIGDLVSGCTVCALGVMLTTTTMNLNPTVGGAVA